MKVCYIEDDPNDAFLFIKACDGIKPEIYKTIEEAPTDYDVVFLDLDLSPTDKGLVVIDKARNRFGCPLVILSGIAGGLSDEINASYKSIDGVFDYICKRDLSKKVLLRTLENICVNKLSVPNK